MPDNIELKIDTLTRQVSDLREEVRVGFAGLPNTFVSKAEVDAAKKEAVAAKRWSIGTAVAIVGIVISQVQF